MRLISCPVGCTISSKLNLFSENVGNDRENLNEFLEEAELQQYYALFR